MRKVIVTSMLFLLIGCSKEINSNAITATSSNQSNSVTADTYLPLKSGDTWYYNNVTDNKKPKTSKLVVLDNSVIINSKTYKKVKSARGKNKDTIYYAQQQHNYYIYANQGTSSTDVVNMEILFLKDDAANNDTWSVPAGNANGHDVTCYGKIIDNNTNITIGGVTYTNVIHTYIELRSPFLSSYIVVDKQDFYVAKNIGVVKNVQTALLPSTSTTTTTITGYTLK